MQLKYGRNNQNTSNLSSNNINLYTSVRVIDIILDDKHPDFNKFGGWASIGLIKYQPVYSSFVPTDYSLLPYAKPLQSNIKQYPLKNEIVYILSLPSENSQNSNVTTDYYVSSVNIWNSQHHNALPYTLSGNNDYIQTENGFIRKNDNSPDIDLGSTFVEKSNIHPLLPFEGDIIYEGRFGNSIRFSSTNGNWDKGEKGSPITIIRNGQGSQNTEGWVPVIEDFNNIDSLILLSQTQPININVACNLWDSYNTVISNDNIIQDNLKDQIIEPVQIPINSNPEEEELDYSTVSELDSIINLDDTDNPTIDSSPNDTYSNSNNLLKVKHQIQLDKKWCYIACLSMLMDFYNKPLSQNDIYNQFTYNGSLNNILVSKKLNLDYSYVNLPYKTGVETIKDYFENNRFPIILEKKSLSNPTKVDLSHFVLILGFDEDNNIIIHDPGKIKGINVKLNALRDLKISKGSLRIFKQKENV